MSRSSTPVSALGLLVAVQLAASSGCDTDSADVEGFCADMCASPLPTDSRDTP